MARHLAARPTTRHFPFATRSLQEQRVDGILRRGVGLVLRTMQKQRLGALGMAAFRLVRKPLRVAGFDSVGEARHPRFDLPKRVDDLADALAGDVLEGAGL